MIIALCIEILSNNGTLINIYPFSFVKRGDNYVGMREVVEEFRNLAK
jgi:hypothetical protein